MTTQEIKAALARANHDPDALVAVWLKGNESADPDMGGAVVGLDYVINDTALIENMQGEGVRTIAISDIAEVDVEIP